MQNTGGEVTGPSQEVAIDSSALGEHLLQGLRNAQWAQFHAAVAYDKFSELNNLGHTLEQFDKHAEVRISVGIAARGASLEGLENLVHSVNRGEVWIFHNDFSKFHSIYVFQNTTHAKVIIGEASPIVIPLDMNIQADTQLLATMEQGLRAWCRDVPGECRRVNDELLNLGMAPFLTTPPRQR